MSEIQVSIALDELNRGRETQRKDVERNRSGAPCGARWESPPSVFDVGEWLEARGHLLGKAPQ